MRKYSIKPPGIVEAVCKFTLTTFFVVLATIQGDAKGGRFLVTTYHYDNLRTGWNSSETSLAASTFPSNFGVIATAQLDDQVDAQPLVVPNLKIGGKPRDVVYVATESNSVYAIDASSGKVLVETNLGPPVPERLGCTNNGPNLGINGTPVIDVNANRLFVVAYVNLTPSGSNPTPGYQLHALNLSTLHDALSPVTITASHTLVDGTSYAFNAPYQRQRPGLLELNGVVYAGFGSFCDYDSQYSRGWVLGWYANSLAPLPGNQLNDTQTTDPNGSTPMFLTSVWMSGFGIASDGTPSTPGSLYLSTGNSDCNWTVSGNPCPPSTTWTGTNHIQESVAQLSSGLALSGVFTPSSSPNTYQLDQGDTDLGSGGVMLFSTGDATYPYLAVAAGKDGRVFLLNPDNLGKPTNTSPPTSTPPPLDTQPIASCWCGPSFFVGSDEGRRLVTSHGSTLRTWHVQTSPSPTLAQEATATISSGQDPGFFTSVSSNGSVAGSAIIWAVGRPSGAGSDPKAVNLFAFAATPSSGSTTLTQLFSAKAGSWPNTGGNANIVPVVADGKVYVASAYLDGSGKTRGQLAIFGKGGTGAPIASAAVASAVVQPGHTISGTLIAVNGEALTLRTRTGNSVTIDASAAFQNERVTGPLKVGSPYTAQGMTFDASGALLTTAIARAKVTPGLWPLDR
jgi:PQQ enzyme repeat